MVLLRANRPFVYGEFFIGKSAPTIPPPPGMQPFAIEILREFSSSDLIGKLYVRRTDGTWLVANRAMLLNYHWYNIFSGMSQRAPRMKILHFRMEGSGVWLVQHFRDESDETGPYIAVALKFE